MCSVTGCERKHLALGLCDTHYKRHRRGQPLEAPLRSYGVIGCSVPGCTRRHLAAGLCEYHWHRARTPQRHRRRTPAEVHAIRQLHSEGTSFEQLARQFGCSPSTIARICKGISFPAGPPQ